MPDIMTLGIASHSKSYLIRTLCFEALSGGTNQIGTDLVRDDKQFYCSNDLVLERNLQQQKNVSFFFANCESFKVIELFK